MIDELTQLNDITFNSNSSFSDIFNKPSGINTLKFDTVSSVLYSLNSHKFLILLLSDIIFN